MVLQQRIRHLQVVRTHKVLQHCADMHAVAPGLPWLQATQELVADQIQDLHAFLGGTGVRACKRMTRDTHCSTGSPLRLILSNLIHLPVAETSTAVWLPDACQELHETPEMLATL